MNILLALQSDIIFLERKISIRAKKYSQVKCLSTLSIQGSSLTVTLISFNNNDKSKKKIIIRERERVGTKEIPRLMKRGND